MTESNAAFSKRVRPQVSQYETTLIEALDRLTEAEAECERLRGEVSRLDAEVADCRRIIACVEPDDDR